MVWLFLRRCSGYLAGDQGSDTRRFNTRAKHLASRIREMYMQGAETPESGIGTNATA
jgi:hypothetical protein